MIKCFAMIKRNPNLTQDEFLRHWKEVHAPIVEQIPGLRRYVQSHPVKIPGVISEIDGIAETWWDNVESFQNYLAWRQSDEGKVLIDDEQNLVDVSAISDKNGRPLRFIAEEHIII